MIFSSKSSIIKITKATLIIIIFFLALSYIFLNNYWRLYYTNQEMVELSEFVASKKPLPDIFYEVNMATNQPNTSMISDLLANLIGRSSNPTEFRQTVHLLEYQNYLAAKKKEERRKKYTNRILSSNYFIAWGLENLSSHRQCADYNIRQYMESIKREKYLKTLLPILYKKPEDMTIDEVIEIYLMQKAPSYYNRIRHPEQFELGKNAILKKMKNKKD